MHKFTKSHAEKEYKPATTATARANTAVLNQPKRDTKYEKTVHIRSILNEQIILHSFDGCIGFLTAHAHTNALWLLQWQNQSITLYTNKTEQIKQASSKIHLFRPPTLHT